MKIDDLEQLFTQSDSRTIIETLKMMPPSKNSQITIFLLKKLKEKKEPLYLKLAIIEALSNVGEGDDVINALKDIISSGASSWECRFALKAISKLAKNEEEDYFVEFLNSKDVWMRRYAIKALKSTLNPEILQKISLLNANEEDYWTKQILEDQLIEIKQEFEKTYDSYTPDNLIKQYRQTSRLDKKIEIIDLLSYNQKIESIRFLIKMYFQEKEMQIKQSILKSLQKFKRSEFLSERDDFLVSAIKKEENIALFIGLVDLIKLTKHRTGGIINILKNILQQEINISSNFEIERQEITILLLGEIGDFSCVKLLYNIQKNSPLKTNRDLAKKARSILAYNLGFQNVDAMDVKAGIKQPIPTTPLEKIIYRVKFGNLEDKILAIQELFSFKDPKAFQAIIDCLYDENAAVQIQALKMIESNIKPSILPMLLTAFNKSNSDLFKIHLSSIFTRYCYIEAIDSLLDYKRTSPLYIQNRINENINSLAKIAKIDPNNIDEEIKFQRLISKLNTSDINEHKMVLNRLGNIGTNRSINIILQIFNINKNKYLESDPSHLDFLNLILLQIQKIQSSSTRAIFMNLLISPKLNPNFFPTVLEGIKKLNIRKAIPVLLSRLDNVPPDSQSLILELIKYLDNLEQRIFPEKMIKSFILLKIIEINPFKSVKYLYQLERLWKGEDVIIDWPEWIWDEELEILSFLLNKRIVEFQNIFEDDVINKLGPMIPLSDVKIIETIISILGNIKNEKSYSYLRQIENLIPDYPILLTPLLEAFKNIVEYLKNEIPFLKSIITENKYTTKNRQLAIQVLGLLKSNKSADVLIETLRNNKENPKIAVTILNVLRYACKENKKALKEVKKVITKILEKMIGDPSYKNDRFQEKKLKEKEELRFAAILTLGEIGDQESCKILIKLLEIENYSNEFYSNVKEAIKQIYNKEKLTFKDLDEFIAKIKIIINANLLLNPEVQEEKLFDKSEKAREKLINKSLKTLSSLLDEKSLDFESEEDFTQLKDKNDLDKDSKLIGFNYLIDLLIKYGLKTDKEYHQIVVLEKLKDFSWNNKKSLFKDKISKILFQYLECENSLILGYALESLARFKTGVKDKDIYDNVKNLLDHDKEDIRYFAAKSVKFFSDEFFSDLFFIDEFSIEILKDRLKNEKSQWVKQELINSISQIGISEFVPDLLNLLKDLKIEIRIKRIIIEGLKNFIEERKISLDLEETIVTHIAELLLQPSNFHLNIENENLLRWVVIPSVEILTISNSKNISNKFVDLLGNKDLLPFIKKTLLIYLETFISHKQPEDLQDLRSGLLKLSTLNKKNKMLVRFLIPQILIKNEELLEQKQPEELDLSFFDEKTYKIKKPADIDLDKSAKKLKDHYGFGEKTEKSKLENQELLKHFYVYAKLADKRNHFELCKNCLSAENDIAIFKKMLNALLKNKMIKEVLLERQKGDFVSKGGIIQKIIAHIKYVYKEKKIENANNAKKVIEFKLLLLNFIYLLHTPIKSIPFFEECLGDSQVSIDESLLIQRYYTLQKKEDLNNDSLKAIVKSLLERFKKSNNTDEQIRIIENLILFNSDIGVVSFFENKIFENSPNQKIINAIVKLLLHFNGISSNTFFKLKNHPLISNNLKDKIKQNYYESIIINKDVLKNFFISSDLNKVELGIEKLSKIGTIQSGLILLDFINYLKTIKTIEKEKIPILLQKAKNTLEIIANKNNLNTYDIIDYYNKIQSLENNIQTYENNILTPRKTTTLNEIQLLIDEQKIYKMLNEPIKNILNQIAVSISFEELTNALFKLKNKFATYKNKKISDFVAYLLFKVAQNALKREKLINALELIQVAIDLDNFKEDYYVAGAGICLYLKLNKIGFNLVKNGIIIFPDSLKLRKYLIFFVSFIKNNLQKETLKEDRKFTTDKLNILIIKMYSGIANQDSKLIYECFDKVRQENLEDIKTKIFELIEILIFFLEFADMKNNKENSSKITNFLMEFQSIQEKRYEKIINLLIECYKSNIHEDIESINYEFQIFILKSIYGNQPKNLKQRKKLAFLLNDYALLKLELSYIGKKYPTNILHGILVSRLEAVQMLEEALIFDPTNPYIAKNAAITYHLLKIEEVDNTNKLKWAKKEAKLLDQAYFLLKAKLKLNENDLETRRHYLSLEKHLADQLAYYKNNEIDDKEAKKKEALEKYERILEEYPDNMLRTQVFSLRYQLAVKKAENKEKSLSDAIELINPILHYDLNSLDFDSMSKNIKSYYNDPKHLLYSFLVQLKIAEIQEGSLKNAESKEKLKYLDEILLIPIESYPNYENYLVTVLFEKGKVYSETEKLIEAKFTIQTVLLLNPTNSIAMLILGGILRDLEEYDEALNLLERAEFYVSDIYESQLKNLKKNIEDLNYFKLGMEAFKNEKWADTIKYMNKTLARNTTDSIQAKVKDVLPLDQIYFILILARWNPITKLVDKLNKKESYNPEADIEELKELFEECKSAIKRCRSQKLDNNISRQLDSIESNLISLEKSIKAEEQSPIKEYINYFESGMKAFKKENWGGTINYMNKALARNAKHSVQVKVKDTLPFDQIFFIIVLARWKPITKLVDKLNRKVSHNPKNDIEKLKELFTKCKSAIKRCRSQKLSNDIKRQLDSVESNLVSLEKSIRKIKKKQLKYLEESSSSRVSEYTELAETLIENAKKNNLSRYEILNIVEKIPESVLPYYVKEEMKKRIEYEF